LQLQSSFISECFTTICTLKNSKNNNRTTTGPSTIHVETRKMIRYRLRSLKHEIKLSRHRVLLFIGKHASYNLQCCIAVRLVFISYVHRNVGLNISCYLIQQVRLSTWLQSSSVKESKVSDFSAPQVVAGSWRCFLRWWLWSMRSLASQRTLSPVFSVVWVRSCFFKLL